MNKCWNDDKESRPTFMQLRAMFDSLISRDERYNYIYLPLDFEHANEDPAQTIESGASILAHCKEPPVEDVNEDCEV